jgi:hypothetical protein
VGQLRDSVMAASASRPGVFKFYMRIFLTVNTQEYTLINKYMFMDIPGCMCAISTNVLIGVAWCILMLINYSIFLLPPVSRHSLFSGCHQNRLAGRTAEIQ